jgi:ADP-ribose pyrophosphatase
MTAENLVERRFGSEEILKGKFLHAFRDQVVLPDGSTSIREYFTHPGAAMVIPLLSEHDGAFTVVMERQFRYPLGEVMVEFPAGKRDADESFLACAQRELREETGYTATHWARAGSVCPAIAYSTERIDIWFARGLTRGAQRLDQGEFLEIFSATSDELLAWCQDGTITDSKTLTGVMWLQNVLLGKWVLDWEVSP